MEVEESSYYVDFPVLTSLQPARSTHFIVSYEDDASTLQAIAATVMLTSNIAVRSLPLSLLHYDSTGSVPLSDPIMLVRSFLSFVIKPLEDMVLSKCLIFIKICIACARKWSLTIVTISWKVIYGLNFRSASPVFLCHSTYDAITDSLKLQATY